MSKNKIVEANEKIAEVVTQSYKKLESTVVDSFEKVTDSFVEKYLTHEGETVADAKARLAAEQEKREQAARAQQEERAAQQHKMIQDSINSSLNAGKRI